MNDIQFINQFIKIKINWRLPSGDSSQEEYPTYINKDLLGETVYSLVEYLNESNDRTRKTLAINGSRLFNQLFRNDDRDNNYFYLLVEKIKKYLQNQRINTEIWIESEVDIPWNCIYMGDIECISMDQFWGNRYNMSCSNYCPVPNNSLASESGNYATHENSLKNLQSIKCIIARSFNKSIHLDCGEDGQLHDNPNMKCVPCTSSSSFCSMIKENPSNLLFIYFDEICSNSDNKLGGDNDDFDAIIKIGKISIKIDKLKRTLSNITEYPPFIILFGRKIDDKIRTPIRELFIMKLNLHGVIFIESDVPLASAAEYLHDFFVKFTEGNRYISDVLFELRKKYNVGLAFMLYYKRHIIFQKRLTATH